MSDDLDFPSAPGQSGPSSDGGGGGGWFIAVLIVILIIAVFAYVGVPAHLNSAFQVIGVFLRSALRLIGALLG